MSLPIRLRIDYIFHSKHFQTVASEVIRRSGSDHFRVVSAHPEDWQALAVALSELKETNFVRGRAGVWAALWIAWSRVARGETAQLADEARGILALAAETGDACAVGRAQGLIGVVCKAQGKLSEAQAAFGESLSISRRLAEQDPSNAGWQRGLAVACCRVARLHNAAGRHGTALPLYEEAARIFASLVEKFPGFAAWHGERKRVEEELAQCRLRAGVTAES